MNDMTLDELKEAVVADLTTELGKDEDFEESVLEAKVSQAIREVKAARKHPSNYTDEMIARDLERYYSNVYNIALYEYNQVGADFQSGHSENGVNRTYSDREKLFYGIIPIATL